MEKIGVPYEIGFRIHKKTTFGQNLYVIGSTGDLGEWKTLKVKLKWNDGHFWIGTLKTAVPQF